jgi:hypothetical protein
MKITGTISARQIVVVRKRDAMDAGCRRTSDVPADERNRVVLVPRGGDQVLRYERRATEANKPALRGERV